MVRATTGPKNPSSEYPATGTAGLKPQSDFQIMMNPAITGRQHITKLITLMLRYLEHSQPVPMIPIPAIPPRGNWKRILSKVEYPNVDTISGPKPDTAPFTVYLFLTY
jgi:hypothetical protein